MELLSPFQVVLLVIFGTLIAVIGAMPRLFVSRQGKVYRLKVAVGTPQQAQFELAQIAQGGVVCQVAGPGTLPAPNRVIMPNWPGEVVLEVVRHRWSVRVCGRSAQMRLVGLNNRPIEKNEVDLEFHLEHPDQWLELEGEGGQVRVLVWLEEI